MTDTPIPGGAIVQTELADELEALVSTVRSILQLADQQRQSDVLCAVMALYIHENIRPAYQQDFLNGVRTAIEGSINLFREEDKARAGQPHAN